MIIVDDSAVFKTLENLQRNLTSRQHRLSFNRAARKGGNVIKSQVRSLIRDTGKFEHIDRIKRGVQVKASKSRKNPGVNVYIKGPDVPVGQGRSRRFWKLSSYSILVMRGNYNSPGRATKRGERRGNVKGTNPANVFHRAHRTHGQKALIAVRQAMIPEIRKEIAKSVVRNGR